MPGGARFGIAPGGPCAGVKVVCSRAGSFGGGAERGSAAAAL